MHASTLPCRCGNASLDDDGPGAAPAALPASDDWHLMLDAVKLRLEAAAAQVVAGGGARPRLGQPWPLACVVLECVEALHGVQAALREERGWQERFGRDVALARCDAAHRLADRDEGPARLLQELARRAANRGGAGDGDAVLIVDVDGGGEGRARHGAHACNEALTIIGLRLRRCLRDDDVLASVGRGLLYVLPSGRPCGDPLRQIARKLFDAASTPVKIGALTLTLLPSVRIASVPADASDAAALLDWATAALHGARRPHARCAFHDECGGVVGAAPVGGCATAPGRHGSPMPAATPSWCSGP